MKQTKLFETGKQKQQLSLLPALLTCILLVGAIGAWGQTTETWTKSEGTYTFQITGAQVTKIEVWGAGGSGVWSSSGGRGGGGGGYARLEGITSTQISVGSRLDVIVGGGNNNEQPGGETKVSYGQGYVKATGGGSGAGSGQHSPGGSGSTFYILDGNSYDHTYTDQSRKFYTYTGGQGGTNCDGTWNQAGG